MKKIYFILFVIPIVSLLLLLLFLLWVWIKSALLSSQSDSVYFYTFSTIAQGFVGLVAFVGSMVVFRLQLYSNQLETLAESIRPLISSYGGVAVSFQPDELVDVCDTVIGANSDMGNKEIIKRYKSKAELILWRTGVVR